MIDKDKIIKYKEIQIMLKKFKDEESKMRVEICDELLKHKRVGIHTFDFDDVKVKAVKKVTIKPDDDKLRYMYDDMSEAEQACFKFKPDFVATMYKRLTDTSVVDECITSKPAMPTLEIILPEIAQ